MTSVKGVKVSKASIAFYGEDRDIVLSFSPQPIQQAAAFSNMPALPLITISDQQTVSIWFTYASTRACEDTKKSLEMQSTQMSLLRPEFEATQALTAIPEPPLYQNGQSREGNP